MLLSGFFNGQGISKGFNERVKWRHCEIKRVFFVVQGYQIKNFSRNFIFSKKKMQISMNNFKNWYYKNSILSKSKIDFNPNKVVNQSFLSCQKLRDIGKSYDLDFDFFDIKLKYHSKSVRFYNNGLSLKENKIFMRIKYWCYPVVFEEYRKKSMKKDNNLTQICKKKFIATKSIKLFSKILNSNYLFLIDINQTTSKIFITKFPSNDLSSFTIFNFKLENQQPKNLCEVKFLLEAKKNIFFKPSWINFSSFLTDGNDEFKNSTFKKNYLPFVNSSFVLSSFRFISKKDYVNLFQKITSLWNFPLCMIHLNNFSDPKIDIIIFIPRYSISFFFKNEFTMNMDEFYLKKKYNSNYLLEKILPQSFSFSTGVVKTQNYFKSEKVQKNLGEKNEKKLKEEVLKNIILLFSNFAIKNPICYNFFWMTHGYNLKKNLINESRILENFSHLLRFSSTRSTGSLISLHDYVSNFKKNQKEIYFIHLKRKTDPKSYSEIEILNKKDIEVLILADKIDEILIKMVEKNQKIWNKKRAFFIEVGSVEFYETLISQINLKTKRNWIPYKFLKWFPKEISKNLFKVENSYNIFSSISYIVFPENTIKSNSTSDLMSSNKFFYKKRTSLKENNNLILKINGSNNLIRILNHHLKTKKTKKVSKEIGNLIWEISIIKSGVKFEIEESFLKRVENILTLFLISITKK